MLTKAQAEFLDCYFQRLSRLDAASALGIGIGEADTMAESSPVREIISAVVPMIMEDVAAHGRRIHALPKQADQQARSAIEVHFNVG